MTEIQSADFNNKIQTSKHCLIHFWAQWNGYDSDQKKILQELENEFEETDFYTVEVDLKENHQICTDHQVQGPPTIVIYSGGVKKERRIGLLQRDVIRKMLQKAELSNTQ